MNVCIHPGIKTASHCLDCACDVINKKMSWEDMADFNYMCVHITVSYLDMLIPGVG